MFMKRFLSVLALAIFTVVGAQAAPGDTTWVQAHSTIQMNHHGNFDTTIEFPDGSVAYRKIIMTFTLGKYPCPGNPQYCGDWDYTLSVHILPKAGDTMEIGRFISPYANAGYPRTPWDWKQRYEWDVTDFYNELKDSATVRIRYSGYSWGFTGDVKFAMIEGTPPRNVIRVDKAWGRSSRYGDTSQATQFEDNIDTVSLTAPNGTVATEMKLTISGHGSDNNGCSEFCKKFYEVELNGSKFDKTDIWRNDCGFNHMYPQSGSWVYDRGNWCPGDVVFANRHILNGITGGNSFDLDVDFENYIGVVTGNNSWGSYTVHGNVFYYGAFNKTVDVSLDEIVAPNDHETFFRYNPANGSPMVIVTNTGSTTLTSIKFRYEVVGGSGTKEHTWNGSLASLDTAWVVFPVLEDLRTRVGKNNKFNVEVIDVNGGGADEDPTNNKLSSTFEAPQFLPNEFVVLIKTNGGVVGSVSETSWKIVDVNTNTTIAERNNLAANTLYTDTLKLESGMYRLIVSDAGCQGLSWSWNNHGNGYVSIRPKNALSGIVLPHYFAGNFGCGFTENLNVLWNTSVEEVNPAAEMSVYPNPANTNLTVSISTNNKVDGTIQLKDMTGRVVMTQHAELAKTVLNVSALSGGIYTVTYTDNNGNNARLLSRVVIAK